MFNLGGTKRFLYWQYSPTGGTLWATLLKTHRHNNYAKNINRNDIVNSRWTLHYALYGWQSWTPNVPTTHERRLDYLGHCNRFIWTRHISNDKTKNENKMTSNSFRYATKIWLTSAILSPFMYFLISGTIDAQRLSISFIGIRDFVIFSIILGILFSIPNWLLFFFAIKFINKQTHSQYTKKLFISLIGTMLTLTLFYLMFFKNDLESQFDNHLKQFIAYSLTIILGTIIYRLRPDTTTEKNTG